MPIQKELYKKMKEGTWIDEIPLTATHSYPVAIALKVTIEKFQKGHPSELLSVAMGRKSYSALLREIVGRSVNYSILLDVVPEEIKLQVYTIKLVEGLPTNVILIGNNAMLKDLNRVLSADPKYVYCTLNYLENFNEKKVLINSASAECKIEGDSKPEGRLYPDVQYEAPTRINAVFPRGTSQTNMERLIEEKVVAECIKVNVDPDILKNQTAELQRQKTILDDFAMMVKDGRMLRRPCGVGAQVWLVEKGKMHEGRVVSYTQLLKPNSDREELKFADIEVFGLNTIVRRYCHEFEKTVFTRYDHAQEALKKQLAEKGENV